MNTRALAMDFMWKKLASPLKVRIVFAKASIQRTYWWNVNVMNIWNLNSRYNDANISFRSIIGFMWPPVNFTGAILHWSLMSHCLVYCWLFCSSLFQKQAGQSTRSLSGDQPLGSNTEVRQNGIIKKTFLFVARSYLQVLACMPKVLSIFRSILSIRSLVLVSRKKLIHLQR